MAAHTLREALVEEIRDLYNAEKQLTKALPKLAKAACSDTLREAFESHLEETEGHITRLERVFELLDERPRGKHCAGIAGIIEESNDTLQEESEDAVMDARLIAGAQRAEHYEITAYGTVAAWADALGLAEVSDILNETLAEEKAADEKLTALAESGINDAATAGEVDDEMEDDAEEDTEPQVTDSEQPSMSAKAANGSRATRQRGGRR